MIDAHTTDATSVPCRHLLVCCLFAVVLLGTAPVGVAAADAPNQSADNASDVSPSFAYRGDALAHEGDVVFVWRRESLDVLVRPGPNVSGERVCLYRSGLTDDPTRVDCRGIDPSAGRSPLVFEDAGYSTDGPMVYRIEARVLDGTDRVVTRARSRRIVQITNWSALNGSQFADYVAAIDMLNQTVADENGSGEGIRREGIGGGESGGNEIEVPGLWTLPITGFGSVALLGFGGLVALVGLLYVQRRRGGVSDRADGQIVVESLEEPSTDPERVVHLLAENGGQLKQSEIVERTDWSKAKVSRLLSKMADRGCVEKRQDGRQNIIVLQRGG